MKAIILAAGMGTRIQDYSLGEPKSLIEINDQSLLETSLRHLLQLGIHEIDIVVGYQKKQIARAVEKMKLDANISMITNDQYATTGTAYSLLKGIEKNENVDLLILEADVIFEIKLLEDLLQSPHSEMTLVEKFHPGLDGSFVDLDEREYVIDWTHKNMREENAPIEHLYKTINIHKFTADFVQSTLLSKLNSLYPVISSGNESLERVFREIVIENPFKIKALNNNQKHLWHEVDDLVDFRLAEQKFTREMLTSSS